MWSHRKGKVTISGKVLQTSASLVHTWVNESGMAAFIHLTVCIMGSGPETQHQQ